MAKHVAWLPVAFAYEKLTLMKRSTKCFSNKQPIFNKYRHYKDAYVLETLAVGPDYHQKGYESTLLNWAMTFARLNQRSLLATPGNAAKAIYEEKGMQFHGISTPSEIGGWPVPVQYFYIYRPTAVDHFSVSLQVRSFITLNLASASGIG